MYITTVENLRNRQLGDRLMTSHRLRFCPLPPNEVCRIAQYISEREGIKEGQDGEDTLYYKKKN